MQASKLGDKYSLLYLAGLFLPPFSTTEEENVSLLQLSLPFKLIFEMEGVFVGTGMCRYKVAMKHICYGSFCIIYKA